jgi:hypothetical protein
LPATGRATKSPDIEAVESRLRYALGSPVAIIASGKGGRIELRYADQGDLNRILDLIAPETV